MPLRVFVIDDEECIRDPLQWYLNDQGHEVLTAEDPSACPVYAGHDCDKDFPCGHVLFIDYQLPSMNALDFIESMKQRGCKGMTRNKVVMSGNIDHVDHGRAAQLKCRVMQKPLTFSQVDGIIANILKHCDPEERLAVL